MTAGDGLDREAVRRRAEAATPPPWKWNSYDDGYESVRNELEGVLEPDGGESRYRAISVSEADAEFIAHARTDVPALLDALEAAEAEVARWKRRTAEATWHGEYTLGRWAPEMRHADPCDCDEDEEVAGEACMDNSEWAHAVFAAGGAHADRLICTLPRRPPQSDDDEPEAMPLVPRSALVQVGWTHCHGRLAEMAADGYRCTTAEPVYVLRTEGGAS